jgi:hypothetical protein
MQADVLVSQSSISLSLKCSASAANILLSDVTKMMNDGDNYAVKNIITCIYCQIFVE